MFCVLISTVVSSFLFDEATGELQLSSTSNANINPSYMAIHRRMTSVSTSRCSSTSSSETLSKLGEADKYVTNLYAINETRPGRVTALRFDANTGHLDEMNNIDAGGMHTSLWCMCLSDYLLIYMISCLFRDI